MSVQTAVSVLLAALVLIPDASKSTSVSISPSGEITEGSSVTLTCSSTANPPVKNYTWFKINGTGPLYKGANYTIINISSADSGQYYCEAQNEFGSNSSAAVTVNVLYAPRSTSVSISPSGAIAEGSSVTLTCSSSANPPVKNYSWFKINGTGPLYKGANYTIINISSADSRQYYCEAQNEIGSNRSAAVTVNVLYAPKSTSVSISPSGAISEGSSVTLTCSSSANPLVKNYSWFKINGTGPLYKGANYTIINISSADSGQYYCEAQNEFGSNSSAAVTVNVLYAPKSTSVSISPSGAIAEGSSVTLTCSSSANPPVKNYSWFKINGTGPLYKGPNYTIINISSADSRQYYCEAQNEIGSNRSAAVTVNVLYAPKSTSVSISPSGAISEGSSVTLTCSSSANPLVKNYSWFKINGTGPLYKGANYTIINISSADSGQYYCEAQNEFGSNSSAAITVNVLYAPKSTSVSISPSGAIAEGGSVTLTCSSSANPPVKNYTWFKINGTGPLYKGSNYTIINISSADSGQYYCEAQNEIGSNRSAAGTVNVLYAPKNTSVSISPSGAIAEGSSVTLTCSNSANPPVKNYTWFKLSDAGVWRMESGQSLTIAEVRSADSGQYYCEAQNNIGARRSAAVTLALVSRGSSQFTVLVAVVGSVAVLLLAILIILLIRRRVTALPTQDSSTGGAQTESPQDSDNYTALQSPAQSPVYENIRTSEKGRGN
ncbi:B-cell receptor CD22-like [Lepisosteus oculatus]|uniref:B-cell receptor CD22-like n=1 Tax=Lepisosteus oculatus TaxID=7918 RepID=UPI0037169A85